MSDKLKALGKRPSKMSDAKMAAKRSVLNDLRGQAMEKMGSKLGGLKKVTVASDSPKGLEEGLEKAKEMLDSNVDASEHAEGMEEEAEEEMSMEAPGEMSPGGEQPELSLEALKMENEELKERLARLEAMVGQ